MKTCGHTIRRKEACQGIAQHVKHYARARNEQRSPAEAQEAQKNDWYFATRKRRQSCSTTKINTWKLAIHPVLESLKDCVRIGRSRRWNCPRFYRSVPGATMKQARRPGKPGATAHACFRTAGAACACSQRAPPARSAGPRTIIDIGEPSGSDLLCEVRGEAPV